MIRSPSAGFICAWPSTPRIATNVPGQDSQDREDTEQDAEQSDGGVDRPTGQVLSHALEAGSQLSQT